MNIIHQGKVGASPVWFVLIAFVASVRILTLPVTVMGGLLLVGLWAAAVVSFVWQRRSRGEPQLVYSPAQGRHAGTITLVLILVLAPLVLLPHLSWMTGVLLVGTWLIAGVALIARFRSRGERASHYPGAV